MLGAVDRLLEQGVDGIVVIAPMKQTADVCAGIDHGVPLVAVGCGTNAPLASVAVDNAAGAALATRYLLGLGHATVHHVAGPRRWLDAQERITGWRGALKDAGVRAPAPGRHALAALVGLIDGQPAPGTCLRIAPQLVERASAGPPRR